MKKTKYIVVKTMNIETMVIFEDIFTHGEMARMVDQEVISAGFLSTSSGVNDDGHSRIVVTAWGESVSLKVASRPEKDTRLARKALDLDDA